jgi:hypothetical protein
MSAWSLALRGALTGLFVILAASQALAGERDGARADPIERFRDPTPVLLMALSSPSRHFPPSLLMVMSVDGVVESPLPRWAEAEGASKLDLSGVPLIGSLFGARPAMAEMTEEQWVGPLLRRGDALIAQIDRPTPTGWISQPITLISRAPMTREIIAIRLEPAFEKVILSRSIGEDPEPAAPGVGHRVGDVYLAQRGLVLAPPRDWLTGFGLQ